MTVDIGQAYSDYNVAIAQITADRDAIFATDANTEQTADQAAVDQYTPIVQATSDALDATASSQDQAFNTATDQADAAQDTADGAADGIYNAAKQGADAQEQSDFNTADAIEATAEANDQAGFQSLADSASSALNDQLTAHQNTFDTTSSGLQTTHDNTVSAAQAAFQSTVAADKAAFDATQASLDATLNSSIAILAANEQDVLNNNFVSPGMYGSVANDPGYLADQSAAVDAYNEEITALAATRDRAYASANNAEETTIANAENQLSLPDQNAANAYNVTASAAEIQYASSVQEASTTEANGLADHLATYNTSAAATEAQYDGAVQQAQNILTAATNAATATYNTGAGAAQAAYDSWSATRTAAYNTDVQNRQNQLATENQAAQDAYNAASAGYSATDVAADEAAVDAYNNAVAGFATTRGNKDNAASQAFDATMAPAWTAEQAAEDAYSQTVMQIYMDAMNNNVPPDQGALDAALTTVETARKAFDVANAGANVTLTQATTQDSVDYWTDELDANKAEQVAIAAADGVYLIAIAGVQKTLTDAQANNQANCDADLANLDAGYSADLDQHQASLQQALAALAKTRDDAIDDAQGVDANSEDAAWATEQGLLADASAVESKADADTVGVFKKAVAGFWQGGVDAIAAAQQTMIAAEAAALVTATDQINAARGQGRLDRAAADVAFDSGNADATLEYAATMIDAWASTFLGFAPNDPAMQAVAAAVSNYASSVLNLSIAEGEQLEAAQEQELALDVAAAITEAHAEAAADQVLTDGIAGAAVQQNDDDASSQVAFAEQVTAAAVNAAKQDVDAARTALGSYLAAEIADAMLAVAASVTQVHSYLTNAATWVATVVPAWISAQVAEINAAAQAAGDIAHDKANVIQLYTANGKARLIADVPAEEDAVAKGADAVKVLQLKIVTARQLEAINEAQAAGQVVLQNPLLNYVFAPVGPYGMPRLVDKDTLPPPFNMMENSLGNTPFTLSFEEEKLLTDMPSLAAAASEAARVLHQRMETNALLSRMQVALGKANERMGQLPWRERPDPQDKNERLVRAIAFAA